MEFSCAISIFFNAAQVCSACAGAGREARVEIALREFGLLGLRPDTSGEGGAP